jgi:ribosomal protein S18 acetylase RimI-like enzyme
MLYVDFDNKAALNLYNSLGFKISSKDILYRHKMTKDYVDITAILKN